MDKNQAREILRELNERGLKLTQGFTVERFCFKQQVDFIRDPARYKTAVCSRRAGKTVSGAAYLLAEALSRDNVACLYITLSRLNAKRIIWGDLIRINREFELGGKVNETELTIKFPNNSVIYLSGAKDTSEVEKFRGVPNLVLVLIDEAQAFRSYIESMVDDILAKTLYDYNGTLCVMGTPRAVPAGYFYDVSHNTKWSHHSWTMFQNPHLELKSGKTAIQLVQQDCERMGVSLDDARIQRECFGKWTTDLNNLVFKYNKEINDYSLLPDNLSNFVVGIDLGFDDADAITVIGWSAHNPVAYLVEEIVRVKQGITELSESINNVIIKYNPMSVVMDTGGLGKKIAEEIRRRYSLPIKSADKARKFENIEILNDALRTKRFFAKKESIFAQDCQILEWDFDKSTGDKLVVSDSFHSDACDSTLYAYKEALHWLETPKLPIAKPMTPVWYQEQEKKLIDHLENQVANKGKDESDPGQWEVTEWD